MKKSLLLCMLLLLIIFCTFVLVRENAKKYGLNNENIIENYNFKK